MIKKRERRRICESKKGEGREREREKEGRKEGRERKREKERESESKTENVRERCLPHIEREGEGFEVFEAVLARAIVWG